MQSEEDSPGAGEPRDDAQSPPYDEARMTTKVWLPTMDAYKGNLRLAYLRAEDARRVHLTSSRDCVSWTAPVRIGPSVEALGVAAFNGQLVVAYVHGPSTNRELTTMWSLDGVQWAAPQPVDRVPLSGAALAAFNGRLYLAYQESGTGVIFVISTLDGTEWSLGGRVEGQKAVSGHLALAAFGGSLALAYTVVTQHTRFGIRTTTSSDGLNWSAAVAVDNGLCDAPSLAAFKGRLAMVYRKDHNLVGRFSTDGANWSESVAIASGLDGYGTALTPFKGQLVAAYITGEEVATASSVDGLHWKQHSNTGRHHRPGPATTIIRAHLMHTPQDPFVADEAALESYPDGAVAIADGGIVAMGTYADVSEVHRDAEVLDERDCVLLPGLVDTHIHYPQLTIIGLTGRELLPWLRHVALPEEARYEDPELARHAAQVFVDALAANGTTTALVFGSHFLSAQHSLFEAADRAGLRITSGLVVSDRVHPDVHYPPELRTTPARALEEGRELLERWHNHGRLRYAVTPRFAPFCTEELFESCRKLMDCREDVLFTTHINESIDEIKLVDRLFKGEMNYLDVYERQGLVGRLSVLAHNVHPKEAELRTLAMRGATIAHCPSSNALLGSGIFPMQAHLDHRVRVAMGTDVGAGASPSMFSEGLAAYQMQMVLHGYELSPAHVLYLATKAGAEALDLGDSIGDLAPGKRADMVLLRPPAGGTLDQSFQRFKERPSARANADESVTAESALLGAIFALAREDCVARVYVDGNVVFERP